MFTPSYWYFLPPSYWYCLPLATGICYPLATGIFYPQILKVTGIFYPLATDIFYPQFPPGIFYPPIIICVPTITLMMSLRLQSSVSNYMTKYFIE